LKRDFGGTLLDQVEKVLAAPHRPAHPVSPDFWQQYALADQLEELRQYRPSIFQALPRDPAEAGRVRYAGERE
jgi:hypothetical protein